MPWATRGTVPPSMQEACNNLGLAERAACDASVGLDCMLQDLTVCWTVARCSEDGVLI